jgi:ABC-2 type transport system ATP-binding protein
MPDPLIDVVGLAKSFDGRPVVHGVSLRLMPGSMVGLIGANGGGKTTTLRMLAGLLRPDCGTGTVLQADIRRPQPGRRRQIGYMGQRLALYPDLSVYENLRFHAAVHGFAAPARRITELVARYGLGDVEQKPFGLLSGGWARRVQFAATTLHAPPLLLLDEPTAGLDTISRRNIWSWLADLAAKGHGIVVSTHDLAEAERCSEILFYHQGRAHPPVEPAALIAQTAAASLDDAVAALAQACPA